MNITKENLLELFEYKNGNLFWKQSKRGRNKTIPAGGFDLKGYRIVCINYKLYKAHQLIYMLHYGYFPKCIDHIDGNRSNNKIENLRDSSFAGNCSNSKLRKDNLSGIKGVSWHKKAKKWCVQVYANKKSAYRRYFDNLELAELVAIEARNKYHKEFARHE